MARVVAMLLMVGFLLAPTAWAVAGETAPSKMVRPVPQTGLQPAPGASLRPGQKADGKAGAATPRASRVPTKPLLLLDEKSLGLGCAQP